MGHLQSSALQQYKNKFRSDALLAPDLKFMHRFHHTKRPIIQAVIAVKYP